MSPFGVFLLFPLLTASPEEDLVSVIERHRERSAAESVVALLRLAGLTPVEESVVRLLVASDLAEMGLEESSLRAFRSLADHPRLGGSAFVGIARILDERGSFGALRLEAERAPWEWMEPEDAVEAAYRVARAAIATERFGEARDWLARIPEDSPYGPYALYLRAQAEYGLGDYRRAVLAAERIFERAGATPALAALRDRTAILLGDMFLEVGLYGYAIDLLSWPAPASPFRERAQRDLALARGLAALAEGEVGAGDAELSRFDHMLDERAERLGTAVDTIAEVDLRAVELGEVWPSRRIAAERRQWSRDRAIEALDAARGSGLDRIGTALFESLPPVIAFRLATRAEEPEEAADVRLGSEAARFFVPSAEVSRALAAFALVSAAPGERSCAALATSSLRGRAARTLLDGDEPIDLDELGALARSCGLGVESGLAERARAKLRDAIPADARRRQRRIREQRYRVDDAVARLRLVRDDEIHTLRKSE